MNRILIVKMWALGDILMATPLLRALKRQWPECEITWLADKEYAGILKANPLLDEVIPFDSATWRRHWRYGRFWAYWQMSRRLRRDLERRKFNAVLNLTAEKWWSVWFNAAPMRIGVFPNQETGRMGKRYTHAIPRVGEESRHNSQHYLRPAAALGIPGPYDQRLVLGVDPGDQQAARAFLEGQIGYDADKPIVILHPGTSQESKCWPPEDFAEVAEVLAGRFNIVITGSRKERGLAEAIAERTRGRAQPIVAAGELTSLGQTVALVSLAEAVVTGDTSILHIASALEVPLVGIYGSTRPGDNAPQFGRNVLLFEDGVPCAPCWKADCRYHGAERLRCQKAVRPAQVLNALHVLLKESYEPRSAV